MVRGWFTVRVDLVSGAHVPDDPRCGRIMLVGPRHTLKDLAEAVDLAFARWDLAHLHEFEFPDGRRYGVPGEEFAAELGEAIDYEQVQAGSVASKGELFMYVFDFGDNWLHLCRVERSNVSPTKLAGIVPEKPIPVWGWGWIPDQYGRRWDGDDGEEEGPCPVCGNPWSDD